MNVYGYSRLVGYDAEFEIVPDILEAIEVEDGRIFTLTCAKGHKWSDGASLHHRGFPLLVGRHRQQRGTEALRPAPRAEGQRRIAEGRDPRRDHDPLQLVEAESGVPAGAGRRPARSTSTRRPTI